MQLVVISYNRIIYYQLYEHMKHKMQGRLSFLSSLNIQMLSHDMKRHIINGKFEDKMKEFDIIFIEKEEKVNDLIGILKSFLSEWVFENSTV